MATLHAVEPDTDVRPVGPAKEPHALVEKRTISAGLVWGVLNEKELDAIIKQGAKIMRDVLK